MRISDWSSDVCSSDLAADTDRFSHREIGHLVAHRADMADDLMAGNARVMRAAPFAADLMKVRMADAAIGDLDDDVVRAGLAAGDRQRLERTIGGVGAIRSEEHTSELQSLMRISYAVFCLKKKKNSTTQRTYTTTRYTS